MVKWNGERLNIDGEDIQILSGSIHYFRTFPEQWEDRLIKLKNMGFNTVETYCCWNLHEPREGTSYLKECLIWALFGYRRAPRALCHGACPGPYICGEWDFGGLPAWLLKDENALLRSNDEYYFSRAEKYIEQIMKIIVPRMQTNGGNVILLAAENEYGSFSNSHKYMNRCARLLEKYGADIPIFTSDGHTPMMLCGGTAEGALPGLISATATAFCPSIRRRLKIFQPITRCFI